MFEKDNLNLVRWKKIKDCVPYDLCNIQDSSQNPVTTYDNYNFRGFTKIVFPSVL